MNIKDEPELGVYRNARYFQDHFPFYVERVIHEARHFSEKRLHQREFWKISCILAGRGVWLLGAEHDNIGPGSLIFSHPDAQTSYLIESESLELYNVLFLPSLVEPFLGDCGDDCGFFRILDAAQPESVLLYIQESDRRIREILRVMEDEFIRRPGNHRQLLQILLAELLIRMARRGGSKLRKDHTIHAVAIIDRMIETEFRDNLTLEDFSLRTGLPPSRLCQLYRAAAGKTVMTTLRERRLREAERLLTRSDFSILEICSKSGFGDLSSFNRAFRAGNGVTPSEFRRSKAKI